ncbi:MAG: nickel-type superoxide dismutase maturation protease [Candidatus Colwellbacteria bacterium]|nr:nickel-type superoxide dismutase maturation protease [Candidatus Colwellbacteria bacterium]
MFLSRFIVSGRSMEPVFREGGKLLVSNLIYKFRGPKADEVVVLKDPRDGRLILKRIKEVRGDEYFVSGDNEGESTDSRSFGWITKKDVLGKVLIRYF